MFFNKVIPGIFNQIFKQYQNNAAIMGFSRLIIAEPLETSIIARSNSKNLLSNSVVRYLMKYSVLTPDITK